MHMLCKYDFVRFIVDLFVGAFNCLNFSLEKKKKKKSDSLNCINLIHFRLTAGRLRGELVHCYTWGRLRIVTVHGNTVGRHC